jgi:hypothetical protein
MPGGLLGSLTRPLSGAAGGRYSGDIVLPLMGRDLCLEAKARADGFRELYGWLDQRDVLIVKADRQEALVVVRLSLAIEIAQATVDETPIDSATGETVRLRRETRRQIMP